jgi:hypothetical protein
MHRHRLLRWGAAFAVAAVLAGAVCAKKRDTSGDTGTKPIGAVIAPAPDIPAPPATAADTNRSDQATLTRLEREARALAKTSGCRTVNDCRTAPVGWRGCGGPRTYLLYCAAATDTIALYGKLKELEEAEKAYNAKSGMMSTCELRMPPKTVLRGSSCREVPAEAMRAPQ